MNGRLFSDSTLKHMCESYVNARIKKAMLLGDSIEEAAERLTPKAVLFFYVV